MGKPGDKRARRAKKRRQAEQRRKTAHARESAARPEPTLEAMVPRLRKAAVELVTETRLQQDRSSGCHFPEGALPRRVRRDAGGWSFLLSTHVHPHGDGETEHWHLSAALQPRGRGSKRLDWNVLGFMVGEVQDQTGRPRGDDEEPHGLLTPLETTDPNRVHHWAWHADGSELDPVVEHQLRTILNPPAGEA